MELSIPEQQVNEPVKITVIFPTTAYFLSGIRDFTMQIVKNISGFSDQWAFRFQSVVDELCNNAIEHGSKAGNEVKLSFVIERNKKIEVIVEDTGTGPSSKTAEQMAKILAEKKALDPTQILEIRGRGLSHIVSPLTDEIYFEDLVGGGIRTRVVKYFTAE